MKYTGETNKTHQAIYDKLIFTNNYYMVPKWINAEPYFGSTVKLILAPLVDSITTHQIEESGLTGMLTKEGILLYEQ